MREKTRMKISYLSIPDDRDGNPRYLLVLSEVPLTAGIRDTLVLDGKRMVHLFEGCVGVLCFEDSVEVQL
jgi:hypothetical protein